jgi:hypothetical protein
VVVAGSQYRLGRFGRFKSHVTVFWSGLGKLPEAQKPGNMANPDHIAFFDFPVAVSSAKPQTSRHFQQFCYTLADKMSYICIYILAMAVL